MKKKGFTLIELVMVIVIIGILAAIALPRFANMRRDANKAACDGNVSSIRGALSAYYARTAVSPGFDSGGRAASGFPKAVSGSAFVNCFFVSAALPKCPKSNSSGFYLGAYSSISGNVPLHTLDAH